MHELTLAGNVVFFFAREKRLELLEDVCGDYQLIFLS
jgi:hypothetical protein